MRRPPRWTSRPRTPYRRTPTTSSPDFGAVHYVFNNAGVTLAATIEHATIEEYEWLLGVNLWGPIYGTKAFLPDMLRQHEGHVVNFSSVFGFVTVPDAVGVPRLEVRDPRLHGVPVARAASGRACLATCVHPGGIATNIGAGARVGVNADATEQRFLASVSAMLRTTPEECASEILTGVERRKKRIVVGPQRAAARPAAAAAAHRVRNRDAPAPRSLRAQT